MVFEVTGANSDNTVMKNTPKAVLLSTLIVLVALIHADAFAEGEARGIPTPEQIAWHEMEIEMFLCLDPCTWQGREYDDHSIPLSEINPAQLDTDQWCEVAKSFGAKQILFVAKHTGGFCWWQTDTSDYSIKNTPYKNGQGDVLDELAQSCRKHGLKLGVYIYPGDDQWGAGIGSGGRTKDPAKQEAYAQVLRQQWTEVLTRYGEVSEVWFDGSCVIEVGDILEKHAPKAMVFQGPHATLRWPGNEKGIAPYPTWQTVSRADAKSGGSTGQHSDPDGDAWLPMEMDTTLLDHKWFWAPNTDHMLKPLDHLMDIYYKSVGRGCVLLLDATPDTAGLIPEAHIERYREFGEAIRRIYANKKGETAGTGRAIELRFDSPADVNHLITMEDIRHGHVVRAYGIDGLVNGEWTKLVEGSSVGYKRIDTIDTVHVEGLRLRVTEAVGEPVITSFAAYDVSNPGITAAPSGATPNPWQEVLTFEPGKWHHEWQTVEIDLTQHIITPGQYEVELLKNAGEVALEVSEALPVMAGTKAPRLISPLDRPNAWLIRRTDQVTTGEKGRTTLQLTARLAGVGDWEGQLQLRSIE